MENKEIVGADSISAREKNMREHMECSPTDSVQPECNAPQWYVDLKQEEFVAFRMLMARLLGPLRQRIPTLIVSVLCFLMLGGYALFEWMQKGWTGYPDPVLAVGAALVLIPALIVCVYMPHRLRKNAERQYRRSVEAGMDFYGELVVYPDCIEKVGQAVTAHIRLDERMLFIETADMMVITAAGSPAIVIPARCATDEMARAVRQAIERLPARNRKFLGRIQPKGEPVDRPLPIPKPEELWVNTFTYTAEEYAVVLRSIIQQHFWRMAPLLAVVSMMGALAFGYNGESLLPCVGYFVVFIAVLILFNLVLPLHRVKSQSDTLSPHDLTMQVRMDTMALRMKLPKGAENLVLWCDVDHVYEREDFVEIVHNKQASLFIPKRCIEDLDAFDTVIKRCRGEQ